MTSGRRVIVNTGDRYGMLTVVEELPHTIDTQQKKQRVFKLVCDCGEFVIRQRISLRQSASCGCRRLGRSIDLTGKRFGKLVAKYNTLEKTKIGSYIWNCQCDCGKEINLACSRLVHEGKDDCGCSFVESKSPTAKVKLVSPRMSKHGMTGTPTYRSWSKLCSRTRSEEYAEWHGDVTICDRWDTTKGGSFENFLEDMGERPEGMTINRINGAKCYSKETCEWASLSLQSFDQKRKKQNKSGRSGVNWRADREVWEARIGVNNEIKILYYGPSFEDAVSAREEAELKYYGFNKD